MVNILLFLAGCFVLSLLLGLSYGQMMVGLGAISIPATLVYKIGKPAFDAILKDYFLELPTESLIFLAGLQFLFLVCLLGAALFVKVFLKIRLYEK